MASNLVFDFRHHYVVGERRASEPSAYQFDQGHLAEIYVPENATSWEIHYAFGDFPLSEGYNVDTVEAADDGGYVITAHIPNDLFERCGELRVYIMAVEDESIITTYEGYVFIKNRNQPDDYVDDDPDNHAVKILDEAQRYATKSESFAVGGTGTRLGEDTDNAKYYLEQAEEIAESIPEDYTELSEDVQAMKVGKADKDIVYNVYPTSTAQGNPATFTDGADNIPVKDLKVSIVPTQDLHGYANPWPGGGGKNLLKMRPSGSTATLGDVAATWNNDGTITLNGASVNNMTAYVSDSTTDGNKLYLPAGTYTISGMEDIDDTNSFIGVNVNSTSGGYTAASKDSNKSFTIQDGDYAFVRLRVGADTTYNNVKVYPMIRKSTDSATWEPYTNICPITGMTDVDVVRRGKNLIDANLSTTTTSGITFTVNPDKSITVNGTNTSSGTVGFNLMAWDEINMTPGKTYKMHLYDSGGVSLQIYSNNTYLTFTTGSDVTFTIPSDSTANFARLRVGGGETINNATVRPIVVEATDSTEWERPYTPQTVTTDLGRTVYGGTLDVTTGVLTVDRGFAALTANNVSAISGSGKRFSLNISGAKPSSDAVISDKLSSNLFPAKSSDDTYRGVAGASISSNGTVSISLGYDITLEESKQFVTDNTTQICYPLATPQTYQLTPAELLSVLGTNHISTDAESVDVEYRADIKLYIEQLTKPSEDDLIANSAIEAGKFFMVGNRLFLSTASIANGATINPGTNATELSLSEALNTLNS